MAKKKASQAGKSDFPKTRTARGSGEKVKLVIVESPTKARTISRFLGSPYAIEASLGHIRDLPERATDCPPEYRSKPWAYLGVDVENGFQPIYIVPKDKVKQVQKLRKALQSAEELLLATDEDREGEAISWHLCEVLQPQVPVQRLVFHEITREAILQALRSPRQIDENLVRAQEARRILDRLFGYDISPLLWKKIRPGLSAGRVQSVAVRLIVDRERQRMAFRSATYWDLAAECLSPQGAHFSAQLVSVNGRGIPSGKDFDPQTGQLKNPELLLLDQPAAEALAERLQGKSARVILAEEKPYTSRPSPPFTTSTLQQEANRKFGFTARYTMQLAQRLYENGHITYMRTDSTHLAEEAVESARQLIQSQYGPEYLPERPRVYQTTVKNAQEAHEAIRPAGHPFASPESLKDVLSRDEMRLYDLIWKRTVACQMADARGRRMTVRVEADGAVFQATGRTIDFPGYLRAYVEGADDPDAELADRETLLPALQVGDTVLLETVEPKSHVTQPPARYTEATLTRALEELGIGRPSTYATIIDTILERKYVIKKNNALVPTWVAFAVCQLLEQHFPELVDYSFTAQMEDELDAISRGELHWVDYLKRFYYGDGHPGLKRLLEAKIAEIDAREINRIRIGRPSDAGEDQPEIYVRIGRYGPMLEWGEKRVPLPENIAPDELTPDVAKTFFEKAEKEEEPIGICPETGKPIYVRTGRFGAYLQRGTGENGEATERVSLPRGILPENLTPEKAVELFRFPRNLGSHPETGEPVEVHLGIYGPYVKCGEATRSLPDGKPPTDITLEEALQLLAEPKSRRRQIAQLRELGPSPVTGAPVRLMSGRYGLYVTDGQTNATLPKDVSPDDVTLADALQWLAEKAQREAISGKKKGVRRRTKKAG
ncbi:type I DNA topoisomerase [Thermogutta sp.]|uniref:type I DNA topoisomerase n=1 Tax=Thermogutta sp. TaxID=1962930 RepID=UPI00321F7ECC